MTRLVAPQGRLLDRQARLGECPHATAVFEDCKPDEDEVLHLVERLLGRNVGIVSRGPCANDVSVKRGDLCRAETPANRGCPVARLACGASDGSGFLTPSHLQENALLFHDLPIRAS